MSISRIGDSLQADVEFVFEGDPNEIVRSHATLLYIECPKLFETAQCGKIYGDCSIVMRGTTPTIFRIFLDMINMGECNHQAAFKNYKQIIQLAERFRCSKVFRVISDTLENNITIDNVFEIVQICLDNVNIVASTFDKARKFIASNYSKLLHSELLNEISVDVMCEFLSIDKVFDYDFHGEHEIVGAVAKFIAANDERGREVITLIRFPTMTFSEFSQCLNENRWMLSDEEAVDIYLEIAGRKRNGFGYSGINRCQEIVLEDEPMSRDIEILTRSFGGVTMCRNLIQKFEITFSVNRAMVITKIWPNSIKGHSQVEVAIDLLNQESHVVAKANGTSGWWIRFNTFLVLQPNQKYTLEIDYNCDQIVEYLHASANGKTQDRIVKEDIEFIFESTNPMIFGINVKPILKN